MKPLLTGKSMNPESLMQYKKRMMQTLDDLENFWLKDKNFLTGSEISIADILGSCEVEQVRK